MSLCECLCVYLCLSVCLSTHLLLFSYDLGLCAVEFVFQLVEVFLL